MSETLYKMERDKLLAMLGRRHIRARVDPLSQTRNLTDKEREQFEIFLAVAKQYDIPIDGYLEEFAKIHEIQAAPPPKPPPIRKKKSS